MLTYRQRYERTNRRGLNPGDPGFTTLARVREVCKIVDTIITQHQRVQNRLGGKKKPDPLTIQIDQAKSLRGIQDTLTGILDVMRFSVVSHLLAIRFACVTHVLTMVLGWPCAIEPSRSSSRPASNYNGIPAVCEGLLLTMS